VNKRFRCNHVVFEELQVLVDLKIIRIIETIDTNDRHHFHHWDS
jgi:hypothetical protein